MLHPKQNVRRIEGVGSVVGHALETAGLVTVADLLAFDCDDDKIVTAFAELREEREASLPAFPRSYYRRLRTMCINVILRVQDGIDCDEPVPAEYRCPITLDWFEDPVIAPNGVAYERDAIHEWLELHPGIDPLRASENLVKEDLVDGESLKRAVLLFRRHHRRFTIMC